MSTQDWVAVLGASLGAFMAILDIQITNASLREIQGSLGLYFAEGGWVSTAYLIAETIVIPLTTFLSRVFGTRCYMLLNCIFFMIASILCGFAWDLKSIVFFRVLQGLSGGTLIPMAFQAMLIFMPANKKSIGLAIFGLTATLAPTLGPTCGGWLTQNYGWRAIFWINLIPGLLTVATIRFGIPKVKIDLDRLKHIDGFSVVSLSLGLGTLTYILEEGARLGWLEDTSIKVALLLCIAGMAAFTIANLLSTREEPLLDLNLLTERNFSISAVVTMITAAALYGEIYALSLYLAQIQNYGALQIGEVMMWVGIPQILVMPCLPWLMKKFDLRALAVIGMLLFAYSNRINSHLNMDFSGDNFRF